MTKRLNGQTQTSFLISYLRAGHAITRLVAMNLGVQNLTARLADLRALGYPVACEWRTDALGSKYGSFTANLAAGEGWAA